MKMNRFIKILSLNLLLWCVNIAVSGQNADTLGVNASGEPTQQSGGVALPETGKEKADAAYAAGEYEQAILLYEQIIENQGEAAEIYYNLGNSYYKVSDLAKAILNYERALLLNPGDGDIRFNLELAKSKTVDKITPLSELFLVTWAKDFVALQSADAWAKSAIVCFLLFIISFAIYLFSRKVGVRKLTFSLSILFVLCCILFNISSGYQKDLQENRKSAIVMSPSVTVKSTPDNSGTDLFVLHEGHKVEIKDNSMKEWKEIRLEDGNVGWIPTKDIEII